MESRRNEDEDVITRLVRMESLLEEIAFLTTVKATTKEWYTPYEFGKKVGRKRWTVRQWCNEGRIIAKKRQSGRGRAGEWMISHDELMRYQSEGLLPPDNGYRHPR